MKAWKRILSLILALALSLAALEVGSSNEAAMASRAKINSLQEKINQLTGQIDEIQGQLDSVKGDKTLAIQQKQFLDEQIGLSDQRILQLDEILAEYDRSIGEKQQEVDDLQAKEEAQYALFCERVRSMEEQGTVSYLSILFHASSFSELLDNVIIIGEIMDYDNGVIDLLQTTRREVEAAKTELEAQQAAQQEARDQEAAARAELARQEEAAAQLVREIALKEDEYQAALQQMKDEEAQTQRDMQQALKEYEAEQKRIKEEEERRRQELLRQQQLQQQQQLAGIVSESGFMWPLPGYYTLTSKYGWRTSPITGRSEFHLGTDIPAPRNTKILAAKSGKVTTSKYHYSYGNYVVVTHSDGYQTLYAHMNSRAVVVGDIVAQGEVLGYVGTTGDSTGNHLHFEVWVNGSRTNAEKYFDLPFVRRYLAD